MKPFTLLLLLTLLGCKEQPKPNENEATKAETAFSKKIGQAHHKDAFFEKEAIAFDIQLNFGGKERLNGTLVMVPDGSKIRIDKSNGDKLIYNGQGVFLSPADADDTGARFDIFTWAYFFAFPYKLEDEGANLKPLGKIALNDKNREGFSLTFDSGIGDAPDDWYVGYLNENNTLHAAGYIVTFGKTLKKAEETPHAIVYTDYEEIEGIPIANTWKFYNWSKEEGLKGEPIGKAKLSNIHFAYKYGLFSRPKDFKSIKK